MIHGIQNPQKSRTICSSHHNLVETVRKSTDEQFLTAMQCFFIIYFPLLHYQNGGFAAETLFYHVCIRPCCLLLFNFPSFASVKCLHPPSPSNFSFPSSACRISHGPPFLLYLNPPLLLPSFSTFLVLPLSTDTFIDINLGCRTPHRRGSTQW